MSQNHLDELRHINEEQAIYTQEVCQSQLSNALIELHTLVYVADISEEKRDYLLDGLQHIEAHIRSELHEMTAEVGGRLS